MAAQLIPVFTGDLHQDSTQLCNARDLHAFLQVGRDFSTWVKDRIDEFTFIEGEDFWVFDSPNSGNQKKRRGGDRRSIDYHLTLDMAKELAMIENNAIGRQVRRYFIKAEKELRERTIAELRDQARHVLPIHGVVRIHDQLRLRDSLMLQAQSKKIIAWILEAPHPAQKRNLHFHLRQINDALGIPTEPLEEIAGATLGLPIREEG